MTSVALALHIASACNSIAVCSEKEVFCHHIHVLERCHLTEFLAVTPGHNSDPTSAGWSTASTSQMSIPSWAMSVTQVLPYLPSSLSASHVPLYLQHHHIVISQKSYPIHNHRKFEQKLSHTGLFLKTIHIQGLDFLPSQNFNYRKILMEKLGDFSVKAFLLFLHMMKCLSLYKKILTTCASKSFRNRFGLNWKRCERRERKQERKGILRNKDKIRKQGVCHTH